MAIIFAEGFDHYGTIQYNTTPGVDFGEELSDSQSRYNMLSGVWAEVPLTAKVYYENDDIGGYPFRPRTGRGSLGFANSGTGSVHLRRTLFAQKGTGGEYVGCAFAVWMGQLPVEGDKQVLISFLDSRSYPNIAFLLQPDGTVSVRVPVKWGSPSTNDWIGGLTPGSNPYGSTEIASSPVGAFVAGTWNHIEVKVAIGTAGGGNPGKVYMKINEESMISLSGVNTIGTYSTGTETSASNDAYVSQVSFLFNSGTEGNQLPIFLDDIVCWDSTGSYNTDFIGDKNVVLEQLMFDYGDDATLANGWGVVGAAGIKEAIDDFNDPDIWTDNPDYPDPPYDTPYYNGRDEDSYLVAAAVNDTVELRTDVPTTLTSIAAIVLVNSLRKTQASTTKVQASFVNSGGTPVAGTDRPVAQDFTYYQDVLERDPAGAVWTPTTLNAGKVRIKRTT